VYEILRIKKQAKNSYTVNTFFINTRVGSVPSWYSQLLLGWAHNQIQSCIIPAVNSKLACCLIGSFTSSLLSCKFSPPVQLAVVRDSASDLVTRYVVYSSTTACADVINNSEGKFGFPRL